MNYQNTCCGLPGVVTDRAGRKSYYDYDPMKRLTRVQDAGGNTLQMDYDAEGNLVRLLDGKGSITKWQYTGAGQLSKKIYADGTEQTYGYSGGRLSATRDARNRLTNFGYDNNGNLTAIDYPNDADVSLTYNSLDKPLAMTDALGTTTFGYDTAARLTSVDGPWNNDTVNYAYDAEGRRSALGVQKPDGSVDQTGYVYDALGRLDQITSSAGTFDYNYAGNTSRITQLLMPNGARTNYSYTALGELDVLQNLDANGSNISRYDYNYDARGVRAQLQEQIEADPVKTLLFSYDVTNQLAGEQVSGGKVGEAYTSTYDYDAAGNRSKFTKTSATENTVERTSNNSLNQTTAVKSSVNGAASTSGLTYDEAGNLAQVSSASGSSDYSFDDANRLKAVVAKNAAGVNQSKTEFVYDGLSRLRTSKTFSWSGTAWQEQSQKRRVYDGMDAVQERDGQGVLVAFYVRGLDIGGGIGGLLARVFDVGTSFMHYDGRGNVVQLTDASGAVSGKYSYDAFGRILSITGGAAGLNPYRFSTKEHVGSFVSYGYRFYSPSLGKWINRDPIGEAGGVNIYAYVSSNPLSYSDSDGLSPVEVGAILASAGVGFAVAAAANLLGQLAYHKGNWACVDLWEVVWAGVMGALQAVATTLNVLPPTLAQKVGKILVGFISGAATAAMSFLAKQEAKGWGTVAGGGASPGFDWGGFGKAVAIGAASGAASAALSMLFPKISSPALPGGTSLGGVIGSTVGAAAGEKPCTPTNPPIWPAA